MGFYDVVIVGAGPAGIFTALELKEKAPSRTILLVDEGPASTGGPARPVRRGAASTASPAIL